MTHRVPDGFGDDPREAIAREFAHAREVEQKRVESKGFAARVRAIRVANGMDILLRKALEGKP